MKITLLERWKERRKDRKAWKEFWRLVQTDIRKIHGGKVNCR